MANRTERLRLILEASEASLVKGVRAAAASLAGLDKTTDRATQNIQRSFSRLDRQIEGAVGRLTRSITSVQTALAGIAAGAGAAAPIKFAQDFERALANVDTLLVDAGVSIERYRDQLLELSQASSKDLIDLTRGLYQTISSGIPAVEGAGGAFDVLTQAQRAAVAGLATTEQAVNTFTTILNAYSESNLNAADVSDKLFNTIRLGRVQFPDLANALGRVAPVAAKFGISLDETLGAFTSITRVIPSADEAATQLRSTIIGLANPSKQVRDRMAGLGIEIGETAFRTRGLAGVLEQVASATGESADEIAKLFPNVRALVGSLVLGSGSVQGFKNDIDALRNSTGATDAAYQKIAKTFSDTFAIFTSQVQAVLVATGDRVLPKVQAALKRLGDFVVENQGRIGNAFESFIGLLETLGNLIVSIGPQLVQFSLTFFAASRIAAATQALAGFISTFRGLITLAAAGQAAGGQFLTGFQQAVKGLPALISGLLRSPSAVGLIVAAGLTLGSLLADAIGGAVTAELDRAAAEAQKRIDDLQKRAADDAREAGFRTAKDQAEARAKLERGELIQRPGATGLRQADLFTPEAFLAQFGEADLLRVVDESARKFNELAAARDKRATELFRESQRNRDAARREADALDERAILLRKTAEADFTQAAALRDSAQAAREAAQALRDRAASALEDVEFAQAEKELQEEAADAAQRRLKAAEGAKAAERERQRELREGERLSAATIEGLADSEAAVRQAALEADVARFEARKAQAEQVAAEELTALRERGAVQAEIDDAANRARLRQVELLAEQQDLIRRGAELEVQELQRAAEAQVQEAQETAARLAEIYRGNAERQVEIERNKAQQIAAINDRLVAETAKVQAAATKAVADNAKAQATARGEAIKQITPGGPPGTDRGEEALQRRVEGLASQVLGPSIKALVPGLTEGAGGAISAALGGAGAANPAIAAIAASAQLLGQLGTVGAEKFLENVLAPLESIVRGIGQLPALLQEILGRIPDFLVQLPEVLAGFLVGAVADLVDNLPGLIEAIVGSLPALIEGIVTKLIPALAQAFIVSWPTLVGRLSLLIPVLIADFLSGLGGLLDDGFEALTDYFSEDFLTDIKDLIYTAAQRIVDALVGAFDDIGDKLAGEGGFFDGLFGGNGTGLLGSTGEFLGQQFGFSALGKIARGQFGDLGVEDVPLIGGLLGALFHQGGTINSAGRSIGGTIAALSGGAQQFATGGFVSNAEARLRRQFGGLFADDVPAVLQAGEGVLNRRTVERLGGPGAIDRLNGGGDVGLGGGVVVSITPSPGGLDQLIRMLIGQVAVEAGTPGSALRTAQLGPQPFLGSRFVRGRRTG